MNTAKQLAQQALDAIEASLAAGEIDEYTATVRRLAITLIMSKAN
jgi:hypothetical protein